MARRTKIEKRKILEAINGSLGVLEAIQKKLGIDRKTFYNYRQRFPEVQQALEDERERGIDFAEYQLYKLIKEGDYRAIVFFLERKGADRGWAQQNNISLKQDTPIRPVIVFEDTRKESSEGKLEG